jgi:energy-coupling factor transport system permease protein
MIASTFIAGKGAIYHFDARAKLLLILVLCFEVFLPISPVGIYILAASSFLIAWYATGFKQALSPLKTILPLLIVMLLFTPFTYKDFPAAITIGEYTLATTASLYHLNLLIARFVSITYMTTLFVWTTSMSDIMLAFQWYGLPYSGSLVITLAFRFIPFIADSFHMISDAHSLRIISNGEGKRRRRIFDILPTISSALVFALKSIPNLAMSLEHRGFGRANKRTQFRTIQAKGSLFTHFLICVTILTTFYLLFS